LGLREAMEELKIDWKAPDFDVEGLKKTFKDKFEDMTQPHHDRKKFEHLYNVIGEHKFWESQPIMKPTEGIKREGVIK